MTYKAHALSMLMAAMLVAAFPAGPFAASSVGFPNEPDGFRDLKWGDPVPDGFELKRSSKRFEDLHFYSREGDDLSISGAPLGSLEYAFYENRFVQVRATTFGLRDFHLLRRACIERFGLGGIMNVNANVYVWVGMESNVKIEYDEAKTSGTMTITSSRIQREMQDKRERSIDMDPYKWQPGMQW